MKYIIILALILGIIYLIERKNNIKIPSFTRPVYILISLGLFLVLLLIIYNYSFTIVDFLIISLVSLLFFLNINYQGICQNGLYVIKGSPLLSQYIDFKDIKKFEIIDKKSYLLVKITSHGSYFNLDFKKVYKNDLEIIKLKISS